MFRIHLLPSLFFMVLFTVVSGFQAYAVDVFKLNLPVDCVLGETCWVINYMDSDPAKGAVSDFNCGPRSYDGHKGTDFAIQNHLAMYEGFNVLSVADGKVLRSRDGVSDNGLDEPVEQTECGNGLIIDHGEGWETQYCHMRKNSLIVKPGDEVKAGQVLGKVGFSGKTAHPHLHLTVRHNGVVIDPYTGEKSQKLCERDEKHSLWQGEIPYEPLSIYDGGFLRHKVSSDTLFNNPPRLDVISVDAPALIFWAAYFGLRAGDTVKMTILDPDGRVFQEQSFAQESDKARQLYYMGRKTKDIALKTGVYEGRVVVVRKQSDTSSVVKTFSRRIMVEQGG